MDKSVSSSTASGGTLIHDMSLRLIPTDLQSMTPAIHSAHLHRTAGTWIALARHPLRTASA
jgi:hypothetical protein